MFLLIQQVLFQIKNIIDLKSSNIMLTKNKPSWRPITYSNQNTQIPQERWGHRFAKVNQSEIAMFGGYSGSTQQGTYFQDLWTFNVESCKWSLVDTTGHKPEARSNHTMHFNNHTKQIIMFGGGSQAKSRFNTISILNWETKTWREVIPKSTQPAPWERTYHTSEFIFPYLLIFGGQGANGIDLNDLWSFNVQTEQWSELMYHSSQKQPKGRRFHSSVVLDDYLYIIGGCTGNQYNLIGDMYRVNLSNLIKEHKFNDFQWQRIISKNKYLERWGHSSEVCNGKIYITCGRVSLSQDTNQTFVFDPKSLELEIYQTNQQDGAEPRRRHSSIVIGNSLLIYGGYNGKYLQDFDYVTIQPSFQKKHQEINIFLTNSKEQMIKQLQKLQNSIKENIILNLTSQGQILVRIPSNKRLLSCNPFFKSLMRYSSNDLQVNLPTFSDVLTFRLIHASITMGSVPFYKNLNTRFYENMLRSMEYFCSSELLSPIESSLVNSLNSKNCSHLLDVSLQFSLASLQDRSAEQIVSCNYSSFENTVNFNQRQSVQSQTSNSRHDSFESGSVCKSTNNGESKEFLAQVYNNIKFDINQKKLRKLKANVFSKAATKIKCIFNNEAKIDLYNNKKENNKKSCFTKLFEFVSSICFNPTAQEVQNN